MDADTRGFIAKLLGSLIAIAIGVAGIMTPPLLSTGAVLSGALISAGLLALGVSLTGTVAQAQTAARFQALERRQDGR